jgi:hypothetical protein
MNFKAKIVNGKPVVQTKVERKRNKNGGWDVIVHAPSLKIINKFEERNENGKRNLQPIQS